jgi:predicted RNase H-like HicB family nuclease
MAARLSLTALYEPTEHGWTQARLAELPAVITCARSRAEARELLLDALGEYLLAVAGAGPSPISSEAADSAAFVLELRD